MLQVSAPLTRRPRRRCGADLDPAAAPAPQASAAGEGERIAEVREGALAGGCTVDACLYAAHFLWHSMGATCWPRSCPNKLQQTQFALPAEAHLGCRLCLGQPVADAHVPAVLHRQQGWHALQDVWQRAGGERWGFAGEPVAQQHRAHRSSSSSSSSSNRSLQHSTVMKTKQVSTASPPGPAYLAGRGVDDGGGAQAGGAAARAVVQCAINVLIPAAGG